MTRSRSKPTTKSIPARSSRTTKKGLLIKLLGAKAGADIKSLSEQLRWQQHTTRAAMSGLRKAGYVVTGEKSSKGGTSKFRILSAPAVQQGANAEAAIDGT
jgi:predicted transcriptional regulator